jgi:TadE-like protein
MRNGRAYWNPDCIHTGAGRMRPVVRHQGDGRRIGPRRDRSASCCTGSVALEFAIVAPLLLLITIGIADIGLLTTRAAALASATRIGAQYAKLHPADTAGIQNAISSSKNFTPPLTVPGNFSEMCECSDQSPIACTMSCAATGRSGPNRVFIRISASQRFIPFLPLPGLPGILTSATEIRVQ